MNKYLKIRGAAFEFSGLEELLRIDTLNNILIYAK